MAKWLCLLMPHFKPLTISYFDIIFSCTWGCPGFDGIAKSCTASRTESSLNWQTNNCNFRKKRRRSWRSFFCRSTRCVSTCAGTPWALFRVWGCFLYLSGLAACSFWNTCGTLFSEYGGDACYAATVSRQLPRITKPVDVPGLPSRTGVQFSSPP